MYVACVTYPSVSISIDYFVENFLAELLKRFSFPVFLCIDNDLVILSQ